MTRCSKCVYCETCNTCFCKTSLGHPLHFCNCGWEARFRYCFAVTLPVLEAKRFWLLVLEMLIEGNAIRFGGGMSPAILSILDAGLGFPAALVDVYAIRKSQFSTYIKGAKRVCHFAVLITAICLVLNVATLISIAYNVDVEMPALEKAFKASMQLYATKASYKIAIDEIQIDLRCCGFSSYSDWFSYDWQRENYASWEDMDRHTRISDGKDSRRSVPFSCCNIFAKSACIHLEIPADDVSTLNSNGCTPILNLILRRFVILEYTMTTVFVLVQTVVIVFLVRIIKKTFHDGNIYNSSCESTTSLNSMSSNRSGESLIANDGPRKCRKVSSKPKKHSKNPRRVCQDKQKQNGHEFSSSSSFEYHESTKSRKMEHFSGSSKTKDRRRKCSQRSLGARISPSTDPVENCKNKDFTNDKT